jgi:4-carboxymuconolactone decarboxylase
VEDAMSESRRERGQRMMKEAMGVPAFPPPDAYTEFTVDALFGDVWGRPGLTRKERRWITLAIAGMTGALGAIEGHVKAALTSGDITPEEMHEFVIHFAHYGGWPLSTNLYSAMQKTIAEMNASKQG